MVTFVTIEEIALQSPLRSQNTTRETSVDFTPTI